MGRRDARDPTINFHDVAFAYPDASAPAVDGVTFSLEPGSISALVGINGAGKSTLISLLCRFREPTRGTIAVGRCSIADLPVVSWQRTIALVQQVPVRYPASLHDNVAFGAIDHQDDRDGVRHAAAAAGLLDVVDLLPHGWDTVLAPEISGGVDLSGGQWQRVALARALFAVRHGARLLILDEPTSALDVEAEADFYRRFLAARDGVTTLIVSHRLGTVRKADRIVVLRDGAISEVGSHQHLVAAAGDYSAMFASQASQFGHVS